MDLYVLFGQRKENSPGEYGVEAIACMSYYDNDNNPEWLKEQKTAADAGGDYERTEIITLQVAENEIMAILRPAAKTITATITGPSEDPTTTSTEPSGIV